MLQSNALYIEFSTFVLGFSRKVVYFHFCKGWHLLHTVRFRKYPLNGLMPNHLLQDLSAPLIKHLIDVYDTWSDKPGVVGGFGNESADSRDMYDVCIKVLAYPILH